MPATTTRSWCGRRGASGSRGTRGWRGQARFTEDAYGALQQGADFVEAKDLARATELRNRARKLYLRALGYGFRGLEVRLPDLRRHLQSDPDPAHALAGTTKAQVPPLYRTGAAST